MLPLVTLCGTYNFSKEWVRPCIESWKNILNIDRNELHLIPDNHLNNEDEKEFSSLGFKVHNDVAIQESIDNFLCDYPTLKEIRKLDLTWRKLLDTSILFAHHSKIVLIDTDVLVNHECILPEKGVDIAFMMEDIPAYRGNWKIVWNHKLVPAFNAGLVIFQPAKVDFSFLEYIVKKYIIGCKDYWWSEQLAWACIAGKSVNRFVFDGKQSRVVSGFQKRTPKEVLQNKYSYFGKRGTIDSFENFLPFIEGSSIIHFAGLGKKWFNQSSNYLQSIDYSNHKKNIELLECPTLSVTDKVLISSRLYIKELKKV